MEQQTQVAKKKANKETLQKAFDFFYGYSVSIVGKKKAEEFTRSSYEAVQSYYPNICLILLEDDCRIQFAEDEITEKEVLGLAIWMQHLLTALKKFMIGLGKVEAQNITKDIKDQLEALNFYEFFEQAKELSG